MNKIKQHRPAYFSGFEDEVVSFETLDELIKIPFVDNFATQEDFHRFSLGEISNRPVLMAEYQDGYVWWVVGFLNEKVELPIWHPKRRDNNGKDI